MFLNSVNFIKFKRRFIFFFCFGIVQVNQSINFWRSKYNVLTFQLISSFGNNLLFDSREEDHWVQRRILFHFFSFYCKDFIILFKLSSNYSWRFVKTRHWITVDSYQFSRSYLLFTASLQKIISLRVCQMNCQKFDELLQAFHDWKWLIGVSMNCAGPRNVVSSYAVTREMFELDASKPTLFVYFG